MVLFILISSILICYFINIFYYSYSILILILLSHIIFLKKASVRPTTGFVLLLNLIPQKANTFMGKLRGKWWCPKHTLPHLVFLKGCTIPRNRWVIITSLGFSLCKERVALVQWLQKPKISSLYIHTHPHNHTHPQLHTHLLFFSFISIIFFQYIPASFL